MITTDEVLTVNGVPLNTLAYNVSTFTGRIRVPGRRGADGIVPGRHGSIRSPGKRYEAAEVVLTMWVLGADVDGLIPTSSSSRQLLFANVDTLTRLFGASTVVLLQTRPDGTQRRLEGEVTKVIDFTTMAGATRAEFAVTVSSWMAFWEDTVDVAADITGEGVLSAPGFAAATAPCDELVVTLHGPCSNPKIESGGVWVQYGFVIPTGQAIVLNCRTWELSGIGGLVPNYGLVTHSGDARWFVLAPGTPPTFTLTDTSPNPVRVQLVGRRKYLTP